MPLNWGEEEQRPSGVGLNPWETMVGSLADPDPSSPPAGRHQTTLRVVLADFIDVMPVTFHSTAPLRGFDDL